MRNKVEIKENKVVKTFRNRIDFVREASIYEKIEGMDLAPKLLGSWDGIIEHAYIVGESFEDAIHKAMIDPFKFVEYANLFFDWYKKFRECVNISLGSMDFSDFIISDGKLYCIDFEHCKPGYPEDDVANLAANICFTESAYTIYGMEDTKIFVKSAWERLDMLSGRLYTSMQKAMSRICKIKNVTPLAAANEYLATFVCCAFIRAPKNDSINTMIKDLRQSNQVWTLFARNVTGDAEKYIRYIMGSNKESNNAIVLTDGNRIIDYPLLLRTEDAITILQAEKNSKLSLQDIIMLKFYSKGMAIENMK